MVSEHTVSEAVDRILGVAKPSTAFPFQKRIKKDLFAWAPPTRNGFGCPVSGSQRGFTLVELVVTMILIGIVASVAMPRFMGFGGFNARALDDRARSVVRLGQKQAIAKRRVVYVVIAAGSVSACFDAACATPVPDPSGNGNLVATASGNVSFSPATSFWFDGLGAPYSSCSASAALPPGTPCAGGTPNPSPLAAALTVTVRGDEVRTFTVERESGYVH